jgi:predicted CoA-binding protein
MQTGKKTLVIGASENPERYSFKAIQMLRSYGHPVVAIGNRIGNVGDVPFSNEKTPIEFVDTVTIYLNPKRQETYYDYVIGLHPKRIIFNPGAENQMFALKAEQSGIQVMAACTLVLLRTGQY